MSIIINALFYIHPDGKIFFQNLNFSITKGAKMKLLLCCIMVSDNTPDMLILDEPTNNLDSDSQEILTAAVKQYHSTLILISHDPYFVEAVEVDREEELK